MKFLLLFLLVGCVTYSKESRPTTPKEVPPFIDSMTKVYVAEAKRHQDQFGFLLMGGSKGDSALFTCLAYAAGAIEFDINMLTTLDGKPLRHPEIGPKDSKTPISKDMLNGIMWCLYAESKKDPNKALKVATRIIKYGRENKYAGMWNFCTKGDVKKFAINTRDFVGRCVITPSVSKDMYRIAMGLGWACDAPCKSTMGIGINLVPDLKGFPRHLAVITTVRNGLVEGKINQASFKQLRQAAAAEPKNALYQAAYGMFSGGDQTASFEVLGDENYFPRDAAPTGKNYCTHYLFERDRFRDERLKVGPDGCISYFNHRNKGLTKECHLTDSSGYPIDPGGTVYRFVLNKDWLPCKDERPRSGVDWLFAKFLATGEWKWK